MKKKFNFFIQGGLDPRIRKTLMYMRLTCLIILLGVVQSFAGKTVAQTTSISINLKNATVETVLQTVEEQTDFYFLYSRSIVDVDRKIDLQVTDVKVTDLLSTLFAGTGVSYKIDGRQIVLSGSKTNAIQQQKVVTGKITDSTGQPLPGVTVVVKGTTQGIITDFDGKYSLPNVSSNATLVFSFVGMKTQEVSVSGKNTYDIVLEQESIGVDEVVVVGYGTQKKANLTGAVDVVSMDKVMGSRPLGNTIESLQGAIPGLEIATNSGQPGSNGASLNIRGFTSINGGSPLVLVDNVPMDMNDINPRDIETVTVLKDAAASSIYGARAAFGVILISTKKGKRNQPISFNYSSNITVSSATDLPVKASPLEFISALNDFGTRFGWAGQDISVWLPLLQEYQKNPGTYPDGYTLVNGVTYPLADSDMYGNFFQEGIEQMHNFSFSGGSEKSTYRVSLGYDDEDGIMITNNDRYRQYNLNTFLSTDLTKNLTASLNIFYKNDFRSTPGNMGNVIGRAINLSSYSPIGMATLPNGDQVPYATSNNILKYEPPVEDFGDDIRLFGKLEYTPLKGLKITGEYTFNKTTANGRETLIQNQYMSADTYVLTVLNNETSYLRSNAATNYHALNLYANYTKSIGNHNLGFLLGINQEDSKYEKFTTSRLGLISAEVPSISTSTGTIDSNDSFKEYAVCGYFGRLNYNYKEKYLLEANARYDGSSRFAPGDRFGFFPSVSAGWVMSEEAFMAPLKTVISKLKFRGSWGEIGNQITGSDYYPYVPGMAPFNAQWVNPLTNIVYLSLSAPALVSAGLSWETVQTANVGVDLGLFNGKFNGSFDLFNRKTLNMLAPGLELPAILGAPSPLQNVADLESKGWELNMTWKDGIKDFHYSFGLNISDNRAFITKFKNEPGLISNYYVGQEIGEIWGYTTQGYFAVEDFVDGTLKADLTGGTLKPDIAVLEGMTNKQNPGDIRYVDLNDDDVINDGDGTLTNPGDQRVIGNNTRRYQFGANGSVEYKNFDLSFFIQGVGKRDRWINTAVFWPYDGQFGEIFQHQLDYWTPERTDGFYPRMYPDGSGNTANSRLRQTKYLSNGAYLRIKNITVGYSLPQKMLRPIGIANVRVFFSGENLFTFDDLPKGLNGDNKDITSGGYYPFLKKYSLGVNISF